MGPQNSYRAASKHFLVTVIPLLTLYGVLVVFGHRLFDLNSLSVTARTAGAVLTFLPMMGILWSIHRILQRTDEYTRMRLFWALAEGGIALSGVLFAVGFLEYFDVIPEIPLFVFGSIFYLLVALALLRQNFFKVP
ncbi:MAG: hypothetical protein CVT79_12630 [Alphaproteobacteria bacterium HGW-Alphaproteobacteria-18]|nr:MAG: hypothetical protein CVT79_12630 [Alphaproteobacteria bacterium HGW-Alphaproteobacteria-18]